MKLGCLPSAPNDLRRRLWLPKYLRKTPSLPATVDYTGIGWAWGELGNDTVNDCAVAAAGHAIQIADWYGRRERSAITTDQVLAAYTAMSGYNPSDPQSDPSSDPGVDMGTVLKYWQSTGIGGERCGPYVAFDWTVQMHWRAAIYLFGFAYIGVLLPNKVLNAVDHHDYIDWTDTSDPPDPGNGHCVIVAGYSDDGLTVVSWGRILRMSWEFAARYCSPYHGAYAVLLPSWATGHEPGALDMTQLTDDLACVQGTQETNGGSAMAVDFLVLLTLTTKGREYAEDAAKSLTTAGQVLLELGGKPETLLMTYGQYDAAVAGECPAQEALTGFVAWINDQGYYSTQTQVGVAPSTFIPYKHHG
jgi:uncharacterized protein with GYD domain